MERTPAVLLVLAVLGTAGCPGPAPGAPGAAVGAQVEAALADLAPEAKAAVAASLARARAEPGSAEARLDLAMRLDAHGLPGPAAAEYAAAAGLDPRSARARYHLGFCRELTGDAAGALQAYAEAAAADPSSAPAHARLGQARLEAGQLDAAQAAFERARDAAPEHPAGCEGLARVALARDDPQGAVALLEPYLARHPERGYARHLLGTALRELGRLDEALPHLQAGAQASPAWPDAWRAEVAALEAGDRAVLDRAVERGAAGSASEVLDELRALHRRSPHDVVALEKLVGALLQVGRLDEANEVLRAATAEGGHPRAWFLAALVHEQRGALPEALDAAQRSLQLQPGWVPAHELAARLRWKSGDLAGAAQALEEGLALGGEDPVQLVKLARARTLLQQWEPARAAARRATAADPRSVGAWMALADAAAGGGAPDEARDAVAQALRLAPQDEGVRRAAAALAGEP